MPPTVGVCLLLAVAATGAAKTQAVASLAGIRSIYVEPMGQDHEAVRFRKLLSDELTKAGFTIVADADDGADAVLSSMLSTPVVDGHSRAYAEVELTRRNGPRVWGGDFPSRRRWPSGQDYVKKLAEEVAGALRTAREKAGTAPPRG